MPTQKQTEDYESKGIKVIEPFSIDKSITLAGQLASSSSRQMSDESFDEVVTSMLSIANSNEVAETVRLRAFEKLILLRDHNRKCAETLAKIAEIRARIEAPEKFDNRPQINISLGPGATLDDMAKLVDVEHGKIVGDV